MRPDEAGNGRGRQQVSEIKDGVFGYVSGTVGRTFTYGGGSAFEVLVQAPKSQYPDKWTVWGELPVSEGDRVKVAGFLSARAELFDGRDGNKAAATRRSVNSPKLEAHEPGNAPQAPQEPAGDAWGAPGAYSDDTPF